MTLGKWLNQSDPQCPHLQNGAINTTYNIGCSALTWSVKWLVLQILAKRGKLGVATEAWKACPHGSGCYWRAEGCLVLAQGGEPHRQCSLSFLFPPKMKRAGTTGSARGMALYEEEVSTEQRLSHSPGLASPFLSLPGPIPTLSPQPPAPWVM